MSALVLIAILIVSLYTFILIVYSIAILGYRHSGYQVPEKNIQLSVLIPFRNEASNLPGLVDDLLAQSYPEGQFQVIFVDDHSEDDSREVLEALIKNKPAYTCLALPGGKHGKKEALGYAIQKASHDWILQLDADCRIGDRFISAHISHLERHPSDLVAGLVSTWKSSGGFMEKFERLDLLSLGGVGAASFKLKRAMMCSGANLAYSKELYFQTRSYDPSSSVASGDDMFLMIGARKLGKSLSYTLSPDSMVRTVPVKGFASFIRQRVRWGAKTPHYKQWDIQLLAILVALTNITILLIPLWICLTPERWLGWLSLWAAKTLADGALVYNLSRSVKEEHILKSFLPASLAYYPVFLMILIRSLFSSRTGWK